MESSTPSGMEKILNQGAQSRFYFCERFFDEGRVLDVGQPRIKALQPEQFLVRAALNNFTVPDDQDLISVANGAEPVGNHKAGPSRHQPLQRFLDQTLSRGINARR